MIRAFVIFTISVMSGCSWVGDKQEQPSKGGTISSEVRKNGSQPARAVYVTYHGPGQLTRRFSKFFEIAADDYRISIAVKPADADARMEVTIKEDNTDETLEAKVIHAGLILRENKRAVVDYCENVSFGEAGNTDEVLDYAPVYARGLVAEFKRKQPMVTKVFVDPIKSNIDPYFTELVKRAFVKENYIPANPADADAVLRSLGTTLEPIGAKAIKRTVQVEITGAARFSSNGNQIFYKSIDEPIPAKSQPCVENAKAYLSPSYVNEDFWRTSVSAAKALAKIRE